MFDTVSAGAAFIDRAREVGKAGPSDDREI